MPTLEVCYVRRKNQKARIRTDYSDNDIETLVDKPGESQPIYHVHSNVTLFSVPLVVGVANCSYKKKTCFYHRTDEDEEQAKEAKEISVSNYQLNRQEVFLFKKLKFGEKKGSFRIQFRCYYTDNEFHSSSWSDPIEFYSKPNQFGSKRKKKDFHYRNVRQKLNSESSHTDHVVVQQSSLTEAPIQEPVWDSFQSSLGFSPMLVIGDEEEPISLDTGTLVQCPLIETEKSLLTPLSDLLRNFERNNPAVVCRLLLKITLKANILLLFPWRSLVDFFIQRYVYDLEVDEFKFRVIIKGRFHTLTRYVYDAEARCRGENASVHAEGCRSRQEARDLIESRIPRLLWMMRQHRECNRFRNIQIPSTTQEGQFSESLDWTVEEGSLIDSEVQVFTESQ